ncbi:helix-turn-helix domain-containing protein [Paenibacillus sp. FSL R10-2796]|uniref:helix-turn-helix domain-containing protein n=1 Tax=Paenibacillus sp. FSL R10-2796 TaxID=2954663 RepID=UPI0030D9D822
MNTVEQAITEIVLTQVAAAEKRIMERLSLKKDRSLTFSEACDHLNMSEYTLRNLCKTKRIPFRTIGAEGSKSPRYIFRSNSLDQWIREEEERNYQPS